MQNAFREQAQGRHSPRGDIYYYSDNHSRIPLWRAIGKRFVFYCLPPLREVSLFPFSCLTSEPGPVVFPATLGLGEIHLPGGWWGPVLAPLGHVEREGPCCVFCPWSPCAEGAELG